MTLFDLQGPSQWPLRFNWKQVGGYWVYDDSHLVPQDIPAPLPDYTPEELAKIEAAEKKRAKKNSA